MNFIHKYADMNNMPKWSIEELREAIEYRESELNQCNDDWERNEIRHFITRIEMRIDELQGTTPEWMNLFQ